MYDEERIVSGDSFEGEDLNEQSYVLRLSRSIYWSKIER